MSKEITDKCEHGNDWQDSNGKLLTPPCGCFGGMSAENIKAGDEDAKAGRLVDLEDLTNS